MMRKLFPLLIVLLASCHSKSDQVAQKLNDTLAKLRIKADFRPLDSAEAYAFINKYYLPSLDTMPTGRRIFINPLTGRNFKEIFKRDSVQLVKVYRTKKNDIELYPPPPILCDHDHNWNSKRLTNTTLISNTDLNNYPINNLTRWRKKIGWGYMCISYPQYNPHTKRLLMLEWLENGDWCGTGRERTFSFIKTAAGWKAK